MVVGLRQPERDYMTAKKQIYTVCQEPKCGKSLSVYNPGPFCFSCEETRRLLITTEASDE